MLIFFTAVECPKVECPPGYFVRYISSTSSSYSRSSTSDLPPPRPRVSYQRYYRGGYAKGGFSKGGYSKGGFSKSGFPKGGFSKGGYGKQCFKLILDFISILKLLRCNLLTHRIGSLNWY